MDRYVTGAIIKKLREERKLTQAELAVKLNVSDKAVSKWETGKGYPDITLLESIASVFGVSVMELLSGNEVKNTNVSSNMLRSNFYVCPVCGNIITGVGQSVITCHGISLPPLEAEPEDELHKISVECVEDEYFVSVSHPMTREHSISFIAAVSCDRVQIAKLYPEGNADTRFKRNWVQKLYFYCNRDGLFMKTL